MREQFISIEINFLTPWPCDKISKVVSNDNDISIDVELDSFVQVLAIFQI